MALSEGMAKAVVAKRATTAKTFMSSVGWGLEWVGCSAGRKTVLEKDSRERMRMVEPGSALLYTPAVIERLDMLPSTLPHKISSPRQ